ncbi:peptidylprolyl isomerase [Algibacter mikhailovii]|uniref:Peptidyl-prolyl cis-trans isomerase n=1 Tax=Algibacter mikhailovii TaxID=425498 RepID=A0A918R987_9FLAO|nr:peptidylprolyl isomerase [Algibacter mikhailovii]GGZ90649.1 peptidyl-prolyl cis-trans isomerase [Algibacter mikhailovii]
MKLKHFFSLIITLFVLTMNGQTDDDDVLFTVANEPVYASEFIRVYKKNLDLVQDDSQKDVDEYLKLFKSYKLKLKEAVSLGYNEEEAYLKELEEYKKELAKNYISDPQVTDDLVAEAYERTLNEVNANHILVKVSAVASPEDTLVAYNKIVRLRERALKDGFETVREEVHNGKTVFGEKLGFFNGFKMVYKFESVAYNTEVGEISMPFRTQFGYHILNVIDKRKSEGQVDIAHIMTVKNEKDTLAEKPEVRIQDIYKKLLQGENFEALAKQFSDDKNSAPKGGKLGLLSRGQVSVKEFEDAAFSLDSVGDVSEPFQTKFGWHIIKLLEKKPVGDFESLKPELVKKVKRDSRSKLIDEALVIELKKKYDVSDIRPDLTYFESILNDGYFDNSWKLPNDFTGDKTLLLIGNSEVLFQDFGDYLFRTMRNSREKEPYNMLLAKKYDAFIGKHLIAYQEDNLEYENEEFASILAEYRDGLLLFELMENTIWNSANKDSLGIQNYYEAHKLDYINPETIDAVVATSSKQKTLKKVTKLLDKGLGLDEIKSLINSNEKVEVIFTSDVMDATHQALPKDLVFKEGISKIYKHNEAYVIVQIKEVFPSSQKTLEEAKGSVISDYQTDKEEKWLIELEAKYKVEINEPVFNKVKSELK